MNELRMYVEHLFEGRMLTAEMIELKEEIYGNLVARFEDYVASGMTAEEALRRTKESITSIEDVLEGEASQGASAVAADEAAPTTVLDTASVESDGAVSQASDSPEETVAAAPVAVDSALVGSEASAGDTKKDDEPKPWMKALVIVGIVIVALLAFGIVWNVVLDPMFDRMEDTAEDAEDAAEDAAEAKRQQDALADNASTDGNSAQGNGNADANGATDGNGGGGTSSDQPVFSDPEDQREYEATMAVLDAIDTHDCTGLQGYAGESQPSQGFFESLPLGSYVAADGTGRINANSFEVYYADVSDDIDGDALDRALVYNAVAAFSTYPNLQTLNITLREAYDDPYDADVYSFDRTQLERAFANASDSSVTQFNSSLFESEASWDVVRQQIDRHEFCDHQADIAERS